VATICPFCRGSTFPTLEAAKEHVRVVHHDEVKRFIEQARAARGVFMKDPESWAAGELLVE